MARLIDITKDQIQSLSATSAYVDSDAQNQLAKLEVQRLFDYLYRQVGASKKTMREVKKQIETRNPHLAIDQKEFEKFLLNGGK